MGTDNGIGHATASVLVGHLNLAEQTYAVGGEMGGVEHAGILQNALHETDATEQATLLALGGMVLEILAEVTLVAGLVTCGSSTLSNWRSSATSLS